MKRILINRLHGHYYYYKVFLFYISVYDYIYDYIYALMQLSFLPIMFVSWCWLDRIHHHQIHQNSTKRTGTVPADG